MPAFPRALTDEDNFPCLSCGWTVDMRYAWHQENRRHNSVPPLCTICETKYTERVGMPARGHFRDRRNARRLYAMAEILYTEAMRQTWDKQYATTRL